MATLQEIKTEISTAWPNVPSVKYCAQIIDFLSSHDRDRLRFITYSTLCAACGISAPNRELIVAVAILTASKIHLLEPRALFSFDDEEVEIDPSALTDAERTGLFIHPHTGEEVQDFQDHIIPFFVPSPQFWELAR